MRKILLGFLLLMILNVVAFAQPANDDCGMPQISAIDGSCVNIDITGATFDLANGDCAPTPGAPNMWYSFVAQGPLVDINVNGQANTVHVAIISFNPTPCDFASAAQVACGFGTGLVIDDAALVIGNTYYLVVNLSDGAGTSVGGIAQVCVDNPLPATAPPNDLACDFEPVPTNGVCEMGTTVDATQDYTAIPGCATVPENGVFFEFTLGAGSLAAVIDVTSINLPGDVAVILGEWIGDCNGNLSILEVYCGPPGTDVIDFQGLVGGNSYIIYVATESADEGDFQVCVTESGPPPGCSVNNTCPTGENIPGVSSSNTSYTCVDGCNTLASSEPGLAGCNFATEEVVWFTVNTDASTSLMSATVSSTDIEAPSIQFFSGNCNGLVAQSDCTTGAGGEVAVINEDVPANSTIYIAVSNSFGEGGEFELCVITLDDPSACTVETSLEVIATSLGSPLDGPFQPGETVSYCFTIDEYTAAGNGCQWLQGIIPIFGDGWAASSFNGQGMPISSTPFANIAVNAGATWGWYTDVTYNTTLPPPATKSIGDFDGDGDIEMCHFSEPNCPGTGVIAGQIVPPGWFAWNPADGGASGHPNVDWGDGNGCGAGQGPWQICFDLTTLTFPECDAEDPQITDTSVKVYTTADGETGSWNGGISVCANDIPTINNTVLNCCIGPIVDPLTDVICPGGSTNIVLTSDQTGDITYTWTVQTNNNVSGYSDGMGNFIAQVLDNNTTTAQIVNYVVTAISEAGCFGMPTIIPVTVLPAIDVNAGTPIDGCAQGDFTLGGSPTAVGGDNNFTYNWGNAAVNNVSNPTASPNISTTYTVTVTDGNGCTSTDDVLLTINPRFDVEITGDTLLCPDFPETTLSGSPLGGSPNYSFSWAGLGTGNSNQQVLDFNGNGLPTGDYFITLTVTDANGCTGDQEVLVDIYSDPSIFIVPMPESGKFCPGGSIAINSFAVAGENGVNYSYNWTSPSGQIINGSNIIADETGWYVLDLVAPDIGCSKKDSIFIEEIQPPDPVLSAPNGVCVNDMVYITLDTIYTSYSWSTSETTDSILVEPGTYTVTVTNEADCEGTTSITVNPFPSVSANIGGSSAFCEGSSTILNVSSNFAEFEWTDEAGNVISTADTAFITSEGNVTVMVIDTNGCEAMANVDVVIQDFLVPNIAGDTSICPLACTDLNAGDGYSQYIWSGGEGDQIITVCEPGTYTVTVFDAGGCTGEQTKIVTENDLPTPEILGENGLVSFCPGDDIMLDAGSGYIGYEWDNTSMNQTITVNEPGTYFVTVTDAESCEAVAQIDIIENVPPSPSYSGLTTFCPGGTVEITPEDGFTLYEIDLDNNGSIDVVNDTNEPFIIDVVGNSNIMVTDANGCVGEVLVSVDAFTPPAPQTAIDTASFCTDGTVVISLENDYDEVEWYLDGISQGTGQTIEVFEAGTYDVVVSDVNGCDGNTSMVVIESTQLFPFILGDEQICDNTATILDAGSNYETYDWGEDGQEQTISVDSAGVYVVTVSDAGGCSGSAEFTVTNSNSPMAIVEPTLFVCNNNDGENTALTSFDAQVSGANGIWSDPDVTGVSFADPSMVDFTDVAPGFYTFTYTTSIAIAPCQNQPYDMIVEVSECLCPSITVNGLAPLCAGGDLVDLDTLKVTGEDGFWVIESGSGSPLTGSIFDPSLATAGDYTISFNLENPVDNCDETSLIAITVIAPPNAGTPADPEILCVGNGDVVNLSNLLSGEDNNGSWTETSAEMSTGSAFDFSNGTFDITNQPIGEYTFEYMIEGIDPCESAMASVSVIVGALPEADAGNDMMLNCDLLELTLDGNGSSGNNISYQWSETKGIAINDATQSEIEVTEEGTYMLEVVDQFNCLDTDSVLVTRNTEFPEVDLLGTDPFCFEEETGNIVADGTGGVGPYTYSIDGGNNFLSQNAFLDLSAGTYTVIVQDQNTCTGEQVITIEQPDEFLIDLGGSLLLQNVDDTLITLDIITPNISLEAAIWTVDGSIVCEGIACTSYSINLEEDHTVCVIATSTTGCVDSTCIDVRSIRINRAYLANIFTPDENGVNDVFMVQGGENIEKINFFRIYNRWGELMFDQQDFLPGDPAFGWRGMFKGKSVNPGVFAYTTEVLFKNGDIEVLNGDVTVVK